MKRFLAFYHEHREHFKAVIYTALLLGAAYGLFARINAILQILNDSPLEELVEDVLCEKVGYCDDLTPEDGNDG